MLQPLDGPSAQATISVTDATVKRVPESGSELEERKVVMLQPLDGKIRVYFGDGVSTPSAVTVAADGFLHPNKLKDSYEASASQPLFILAETGTVDVKSVERA